MSGLARASGSAWSGFADERRKVRRRAIAGLGDDLPVPHRDGVNRVQGLDDVAAGHLDLDRVGHCRNTTLEMVDSGLVHSRMGSLNTSHRGRLDLHQGNQPYRRSSRPRCSVHALPDKHPNPKPTI